MHAYNLSIKDVKELTIRERRYWMAMLNWRKDLAQWHAVNKTSQPVR